MRIIAGESRGRRLSAPDGLDTRPTSDRVRENVFNIIARRVPGARVLDLFAGSGAMGLEALSRGAAYAVFVDNAPDAIKAIRQNVEAMRVQDRVQVIAQDWKAALASLNDSFSIVFLDPPYRMTEAYAQALEVLRKRELLDDDALVILESSTDVEIPIPDGFYQADRRVYGNTQLLFARMEEKP